LLCCPLHREAGEVLFKIDSEHGCSRRTHCRLQNSAADSTIKSEWKGVLSHEYFTGGAPDENIRER